MNGRKYIGRELVVGDNTDQGQMIGSVTIFFFHTHTLVRVLTNQLQTLTWFLSSRTNKTLIKLVMCSLLITLSMQASVAQNTPAATGTTTPAAEESKMKFFDKTGHWLVAFGISGPEFLQEQRNAFKASAFAEVYIEGIIDYDAWMFNLLNRITLLRFPVEERQNPNVVFQIKFKPANDKLDSYTVSLKLIGSSEVKDNLTKIEKEAAAAIKGKTYKDPAEALPDIEKALADAMQALATKLGKDLAPNLMVRYQNEVFWSGHTIDILDSEGNFVEIEALGKDGKLLSPSDITWTDAEAFQSKGVVDMTGIGMKHVTLNKKGESTGLTVTLKRVNLDQDINELLKTLIVATLSTKKQEAVDSLTLLKQDSIKNAEDLKKLIATLESNNFPMENIGGTLTPLFTNPLTIANTKDFDTSPDRVNSLEQLHKRKRLRNTIRRKVNVIAFANLIVDKPEKIKILLDELLKNSGRLVARLVLNKDSKGRADEARNIVTEFLNQNLERIVGGQYPNTQVQEPPLQLPPVTVVAQEIKAGQFLYINPQAQFAGKDSLVAELTTYLKTLNPPLYVFINYSQDVNTASYLSRTQRTRPKGLPAGAQYKVFTLVNMPGSLQEQGFSLDPLTDVNTTEGFARPVIKEVVEYDALTNCKYIADVIAPTYEIEDKTGTFVTFLSPAGLPIAIPTSAVKLKFASAFYNFNCNIKEALKIPSGILTGFTTIDKKDFTAEIMGDQFVGYYDSQRGLYEDIHSFTHSDYKILMRSSNGYDIKTCSMQPDRSRKENDKYYATGEFIKTLNLPCLGGDYTKAVDSFAGELALLISSKDKYIKVGFGFDEFTQKDYNDRLTVYANTTRKQVFVVSKQVDINLSQDNKDQFSKDVTTRMLGFDNSRMSFVCIPYMWDSRNPRYKPDASLYSVQGYATNYKIAPNATDIREVIEEFYKQIPKPSHTYVYYLSFRGEILEYAPVLKESIAGRAHIYELTLLVDNRATTYRNILSQYYAIAAAIENKTATSYQLESYSRLSAELDAFEANHSFSGYTEIGHGLYESSIAFRSENGHSKAGFEHVRWYRDDNFKDKSYGTSGFSASLSGSSYIRGVNEVIYRQNIVGLEKLSLILSPFQIDFVADGLGVVYAGYYKDWDTSRDFALGVAAVGIQGTILWQLAKGSKKVMKSGAKVTIEDVVDAARVGDKLATKLTGNLKATYDDLVRQGVTYQDDGKAIVFFNSSNEEIASIDGQRLIPKKWSFYHEGLDKKIETSDGYWLVKQGNEIVGIDIGFKEGRVLDAAEVNAFWKYGREGYQPYKLGTKVTERTLQKGERVFVVEYISQGQPGLFASKDRIKSIQELREKLAVLKEWKDDDYGFLTVREYEVKKVLRVRDGVIGAQIEETGFSQGRVLSGGGHQYEFLEGRWDPLNNPSEEFLSFVVNHEIKP